jgi:nitrogen-specific signal transduction histidine kinase
MKTTPAEEVFTAGLLQEIGMLMLYQVCPESLKRAFPAITEPLEDIISWEEQAFDLTHRQVGRFVLQRWGFPEAITESQRHYGSDALAKGRPALTQVLEFARLAAQVLFGEQQRFDILREKAPTLNLQYDQIADTLCTTFDKVAEIAQHFQLKVDATQDIVEVIEKANRTLVRMNESLQTNLDKVIHLLSEGSRQGEETLTQTIHDQQRTVGNLLDAVAHQIRNPLMAIGGFAQRLARQIEGHNLPSRYLNIILQESERLQQVLLEVSSFSKEFTPARDEADLIAIIEESIDNLQGSSECRNATFVRRFPTDVHISLQLDQTAIKRALQLILKAIAELAGAPKSKAEVMIRIRESSSLDWVMVDFCAGLEVFQGGPPQTLLDADFSSKTLGKGLEFLEAWKIIESHGGKIEFENTSDGRHLIVSLPV